MYHLLEYTGSKAKMAAQIAKTVRRATVSVFSCLFHGRHPMSSAVEGFGMLFYDILHRCDHCVDSDDILSLIIQCHSASREEERPSWQMGFE